jgi:hypothetical protein
MVVCPRCGYEFEPEPPPRKPWLRRDIAPAGVANLGCGSMILIALIVAMCSGIGPAGKIDSLKQDIRQLELKVDELKQAVDKLQKVQANQPGP